MTWLGQLLHVARKDVREQAWSLGAYFAVIAIAALVAFAPPAFGYTAVFAIVVFLLGVIVAVAVVQSDSPTASESFWGSRPFRPTAMLGAKVLLAAIIVVVPSIAQGVALLGFDASGRQAVLAIAGSAKTYALWLLAAMVIAGLTRDVRTFIVAFAAIYVAMALTLAIGTDVRNTLAPPPPQNSSIHAVAVATPPTSLVGPVFWTIIAVSSATALLLFLYRRRDARRRIWIVAIAILVGVTIATFSSTPARVQAATAASIPRIPIRVELLRSDQVGKDEAMNVRVAAGPDTVSRRLVLAVDKVIVHLKDGTTATIRGNELSTALLTAGNPLASKLRWLRRERDFSSIAVLPLSFDQRSALSKGFTELELVGTVFLFEPQTIGLLPLKPNRSLTQDGTRLRIDSAIPAPDGGTVVVHATSLPRAEPVTFPGRLGTYSGRQYALVNEARGEAVFPDSPGGGSGPNMLVLPSMPLTDETSRLELTSSNGTVARDSAWFKGASLARVQWTLRGQYNVRVPIVEVPTPPEQRSQEPTTIQKSGNVEPLRAVPRP